MEEKHACHDLRALRLKTEFPKEESQMAQKHKDMPNILSYRENKDQNESGISFTTSQNGQDQ